MSQNILKGIVLDSITKIPLAYANVGIPELGIGTVTNKDGSFFIQTESQKDSIKIYHLGYVPRTIWVKDNLSEISLTKRNINLPEIEIVPKYTKIEHQGFKFSKTKFKLGFETNNKGYEAGCLFKIRSEALLSKISFNIADCTFQNLVLRLNIYHQADKLSFDNILETPIYINKKFEDNISPLEIDISEYNIITKGNILITIEYISDLGEGCLLFYGHRIKGLKSYYRKTSFGAWSEIPGHINANLTFITK